MCSRKKILDFSIEVLFITNLWIIIFNSALTYLSTFYKPVVSEELLRNFAFPNPFKIPLYLGLTVGLVFVIWILHKLLLVNYTQTVMTTIAKFILFAFLLLLFLSKLGEYPLASDIFPYTIRPDKIIYIFVIGLYLIVFSIILIESAILQKIFRQKKIFYTLFFVFCIFLIGFLTFEARFPISGLDYSFFFGPILDIISGKTIYTDIPVQHGFLSVLFLTLLYKINLLKLGYMPAFVWLLYIIQYFLSFYIIFKISKSLGLSLIGLFSIITLNYFSLSELPVSYPQIGPMRWLPSIFVIALFYKIKKIDSKSLIVSISLMSLWIVDAGIALILGYLLTLFIYFLTKTINLKQTIKSILWLFGSFIIFLTAINSLHIILGYKNIDYLNAFNSLQKYASLGLSQLPIEPHNYFWIVMLIYFASIIYFFKNTNLSSTFQLQNLSSNLEPLSSNLVLFSANLMLFASIYFVGRAHPHNLFNISLLPLFTLFLLVGNIYNDLIKSTKIRLVLLTFCFIIFIAYPAFMRKITVTEMIITKLKRLTSGKIFQPEMAEIINNRYAKEVRLIKKYLTGSQIAIFHNDDTYFLYLTGKKNLLDNNPQVGIDTKGDLDHAVYNFAKLCPKTIAADCALFNRCSQVIGFNQSGFFPQLIILKDSENKCNIKYEPIECTKQLCIAQKK